MADQLELQRLVIRYSHAIDERDFAALDSVFTPDARIDYTAMGGIAGAYPEIRPWLEEALKPFTVYMHLLGNGLFDVTGDTATGKVACFNPMLTSAAPDAGEQVVFLGLWYDDRYLRTAAGWRISERVERRGYAHNVPGWLSEAVKAREK